MKQKSKKIKDCHKSLSSPQHSAATMINFSVKNSQPYVGTVPAEQPTNAATQTAQERNPPAAETQKSSRSVDRLVCCHPLNVATSTQPDAVLKKTPRSIDSQTERCTVPAGQPAKTHLTRIAERKDNTAAKASRPQTGELLNSGRSGNRGSCISVNSNGRTTDPIYDPLLGKHPIPAIKVSNLLELIIDDANFIKALKKVNAEPHKAVGVDRKEVREVCTPLLSNKAEREKIQKLLLAGQYNPNMVRTVLIPKANGKMRTLGIATVLDRIVQTMILQVVTAYCPPGTWSKYSYAYQEKLSVSDAVAEVDNIIADGYLFGIMLDLKAFFDNVPHDRLIRKLYNHLSDRRVVKLVTRFLTPVILMGKGKKIINRIGTPQGSVISPWLASMLYLDELDKELTARGLRFVRYADDVTVFCRSKKAAERIKWNLIDFLESVMHCPVNRDKTSVVSIDKLSILGVKREHNKWKIQRTKQAAACSIFLSELSKAWKSNSPDDIEMAVWRMRGFLNHYKRIPDIAKREVPAMTRWGERKLAALPLWKKVCHQRKFRL